MEKLKNLKGFTLIEILVVIAVVGVLTSVLYVAIDPQGQFNKANDARRKSDLAAIQSALEQWRFSNSTYPQNSNLSNCGGPLTDPDGVVYMSKIPCDPKGGAYKYGLDLTSGNYCIRACLANGSDAMRDDVVYSGSPPSCPVEVTACAAGTHNYTLVNQ